LESSGVQTFGGLGKNLIDLAYRVAVTDLERGNKEVEAAKNVGNNERRRLLKSSVGLFWDDEEEVIVDNED
jgi:hypothetical protein